MVNVMFDMDGVLIDSEKYAYEAWKQCLLPGDLKPLWYKCLGMTAKDEFKQFSIRLGWTAERYDWFSKLVKAMMPKHIPFKPGALELVQSLKPDCKLAVVSSSSRHKIEQQLGEYIRLFDCIISGDSVSRGKPEPDIYRAAMKELQADPVDCWAIEDSVNGLKSARIAGIRNLIYVEDTVPYNMYYEDVSVVNQLSSELRKFIVV